MVSFFSASSMENKAGLASLGSQTVVLERQTYEELSGILKEQTKEIEQLRELNRERDSLIHEYEETFTLVLRKDLEKMAEQNNENKLEEEIRKVKSNEERMRSHIRALTRDLNASEEKAERIESEYGQKMALLEFQCASLRNKLNERTEQLIELIEYARYLASHRSAT